MGPICPATAAATILDHLSSSPSTLCFSPQSPSQRQNSHATYIRLVLRLRISHPSICPALQSTARNTRQNHTTSNPSPPRLSNRSSLQTCKSTENARYYSQSLIAHSVPNNRNARFHAQSFIARYVPKSKHHTQVSFANPKPRALRSQSNLNDTRADI